PAHLLSFPTRRSSDLGVLSEVIKCGRGLMEFVVVNALSVQIKTGQHREYGGCGDANAQCLDAPALFNGHDRDHHGPCGLPMRPRSEEHTSELQSRSDL